MGVDKSWATSLVTAHGDKCYSVESVFKLNGLTFSQGAAIYILTHVYPFSDEVRDTENGWVDPFEWIIRNKDRFLKYLP